MKTKKVKLLHITTIPKSLFFLKGQLKFYKKNGFEVHVLSSPGEFLDEFCRDEGVIKHEIELERDISISKDIKSLLRLIKVMKKNDFDIVHTHTPKASLLGILAAFIAGVKNRIYHMHGQVYVTKKGMKRKILYLTEKLTSFLSTNIYAVSPSLKEFVIKEGITNKKKIKVINNGSINGIDCDNHFNPITYDKQKLGKEINLSNSDFVIGFVGRVVKDKGFLEIYYAWKSLREKYNNIKLLIVGDLEGDKEIPKEVIKDIKDTQDIIFLGFRKNPAPYYMLMDVLVFPTYREGFGLVAIESLAMETPVIASNVVRCVDTVKDNKTGFLIPPQSINSIIKKVEFYINNKQFITEHGRLGRKRVIESYPQEAIWKEMLQDYRRLTTK